MSEALQVRGLEIRFPKWELRIPEWTLQAGSRVVLMGSSGSGKSSLLRWFCGLPLAGSARGGLRCGERDLSVVPADGRGFGVVLQDPLLFPHLSLLENVRFPLRVRGVSREEGLGQARELLERVGLKGREAALPSELSGGEKARGALARALVFRPSWLLLDEPFAALDTGLRQDLRSWLQERSVVEKFGVLFVTHDPEEARSFGNETRTIEAAAGVPGEPLQRRLISLDSSLDRGGVGGLDSKDSARRHR
jgi:ABC-type Fe3+/spermidine/putrescine transport system ATPase subunit